jgi:hypothetical protein
VQSAGLIGTPTRHRTMNGREQALADALREYAAHNSWRCEHPPHWYLVHPEVIAEDDCPCGLLGTFRALGVEPPSHLIPYERAI